MWRADGTALPPLTEATSSESSLAWNHDSTRFASGRTGIRIWNLNSLERTIPTRDGLVRGLSWSPDKQTFLAAFQYSTIVQFNADTGEQEWVSVALASGEAATFSGAGELLHGTATAEDQLVYIVETNDDRQLTLSPAQFREFVKSGELP
ncbi:MAG: hypothetical protein O3A00_18805 [Planctomycetota bacterium]|nr:hypothetical protein [Planctomycetota bacterium]